MRLDTFWGHHYVAPNLKGSPESPGNAAGRRKQRVTKPSDDQGKAAHAREATRDLASRIASAKRERDLEDNRASRDASPEMTGLARGLRIGTEFIAAVLVGAGIGYLIDLGLGTSPWGLLILLLMGFAAGILNVIRVVTEMNAASPAPKGADLGPDAEDEERNEN
ncbi:Putative F0F1-ATPase subunit (ATPase_gene1) [Devosia equisanguinis]|uniref:F0F1-ATPase subunit (ATPase_gene1) n=1 Tax=Devosia equisanguinis TaxID=2490941 RepID=A0A3S4DPB6_9HYPH|nr:Putative F0F1-ATPase subunit (ATPase_gene1) [Devosia equisanguinis]